MNGYTFTATGNSSSFGMPFGGAHEFVFVVGNPPPAPQPPYDPGYVPPAGAFVMKGRRLADGSWYVPGYKQRSLALGASRG